MSPLQEPPTHHSQELLRRLTQYLFHVRYWLGPKEMGLGQRITQPIRQRFSSPSQHPPPWTPAQKPATACLVYYFMSNSMCCLLIFTNIYQADRACRQRSELKRHQGKTPNMHTSGTCRKSQIHRLSFFRVFFLPRCFLYYYCCFWRLETITQQLLLTTLR